MRVPLGYIDDLRGIVALMVLIWAASQGFEGDAGVLVGLIATLCLATLGYLSIGRPGQRWGKRLIAFLHDRILSIGRPGQRLGKGFIALPPDHIALDHIVPARTRGPTDGDTRLGGGQLITHGISTNVGGLAMESIGVASAASRSGAARNWTFQLALFAGKTLIVATAFVASFLVIAVHVENNLKQVAQEIQEATKIGGSKFWKNLEYEIDRAADPDRGGLTPEMKQKLLADLRSLSAQWRPFLAEARSILTEPPGEPAKPQ